MLINNTPIDLDQFWRDNDEAWRKPFGPGIRQMPLGMGFGYHTLWAELGLKEEPLKLEQDFAFAQSVGKQYNDLAEKIVGKRLVNEDAFNPAKRFPYVKGIGELFECRRVWQSESWWLMESAHTPEDLSALLDRMDKLDIEAAMFPDNWERECKRLKDQFGLTPGLWKGLRGPVTLATSIYGTENLLYLILDEPKLATRFRDTLLRVILKYFTICDQRSDPAKVGPGFAFLDDNCALCTPEMYAFFGQPILQAVYDRFAPGPDDARYQHSDSDMEHLLPLLAATGMNRVNFGPNVRFKSIRKAMPKAIVEGTVAPFTMMRNEEDNIVREIRRDLDEARDTLGLVVATAGSVNDGTKLSSLRLAMETIWKYGRLA
ncbi:MAG: hypothetical protein IT440_04025 [Phycisphaeraceae bacterium]|nr:hypothetical protein [Phycisphaeraceae bacterium]